MGEGKVVGGWMGEGGRREGRSEAGWDKCMERLSETGMVVNP